MVGCLDLDRIPDRHRGLDIGLDALGIRPFLRWQSAYHALRPKILILEYPAGFGATAADIPVDLSQAISDQALLHYDGRAPLDANLQALCDLCHVPKTVEDGALKSAVARKRAKHLGLNTRPKMPEDAGWPRGRSGNRRGDWSTMIR